MLTVAQLTQKVNEVVEKDGEDLITSKKWQEELIRKRDVYFGMSLHIDGACPYWISLREPSMGWVDHNIITNRPLYGWMGYPYQIIFDLQLFARYPSEKEILRQWRYSNYKPRQKAYFDLCIQMLQGAIFQDSGYSIEMQNKSDEDYIWGQNFTVNDETAKTNLPGYFNNNLSSICRDPNGYFLIIPDEEGNPGLWDIPSCDIRFISKDEIVFVRKEYVWVVNRVGYFRYQKPPKSNDWVLVEEDGYFAHMLGYLPIIIHGGQWNKNVYNSWLQGAKPIADELVIAMSDENLCAKNASFPFIQEVAKDCPDCIDGIVQQCRSCHKPGSACVCDNQDMWEKLSCSSCGGSGDQATTPGERVIATKEDMKLDLIKITNVPVDANKMHQERVEKLMMQLQKALHLNYIDQAQSGVSKDKDMETRYQFIVSVCNDIFDRIIPFTLNVISALRNVRTIQGEPTPVATDFIIKKPTQFQIKTSSDLLDDLTRAKEADVPSFQKGVLLEDFVDKQFGGNDILKKKTQVINEIDDLANKTEDEIPAVLVNGGATLSDYQFHIKLSRIIDKLIRTNGNEWFLNATIDEIEAQCRASFSVSNPVPQINYVEERIDA